MPSKRQTAKQRRAAENRARRAALAARTEHAHDRPATKATSNASASTGSASSAGSTPASLGGGWAGWSRYLGLGTGRKEPGLRAAFFALIFGIAAFVATPFIPVSVDDRGEQVPVQFGGLVLAARSALTGNEVSADRTTLIDANGPGVLVYLAIPLLVVIGSFIYFRRTGRSLPLTVGMLALAVLVMIAGSIYFLPSMIALAVGSFQVRKVEMATRAAEQAAGRDEATAEEAEEDEDFDEDDYDDEEDLEEDVYEEEEDVEEGVYEEEDLEDEAVEDEAVDDVEDETEAETDVEAEDSADRPK